MNRACSFRVHRGSPRSRRSTGRPVGVRDKDPRGDTPAGRLAVPPGCPPRRREEARAKGSEGDELIRSDVLWVGGLFSVCVAQAEPLRLPEVPFSPFFPTLSGTCPLPAPMSITLSRPFVPR